MSKSPARRIWALFCSLKLTLVCLALLMVLVLACTLAQVELGTLGAVKAFMHSTWVWWRPKGTGLEIPIFPGGALVGGLLVLNLVAAQISRIELSWKKSGLWIAHLGLVLLIAGEFVTGAFQVETQMAIEEGHTADYVESPRDLELVMVDLTDPDHDDVYGVPESLLSEGATVAVPGTPISLNVKRFVRNAELAQLQSNDPPSLATMGPGAQVRVAELPPTTKDDELNRTAVFVEPVANGARYGVWLVASGLAPQAFTHEGRSYSLSMRQRRTSLPYSVTLKDFRHDVYPGTDIPRNFSSLVHLSTPDGSEDRDVLISMNQPLRFRGRAFYQASFGKGDTLSILQVVENPGWALPYVSCALVTLGLLIHFALGLRRVQRTRPVAVEA